MAKIRMPSALFKVTPLSQQVADLAESATANIPLNGEDAVRDYNKSQLNTIEKFVPAQTSAQSKPTWVEGVVYDVPLAQISSNPFNPRFVYSDLAVDRMAALLLEDGQITSAIGYPDENGGVVLIEGETRFRGARAAGFKTLRIEIRKKPETDQKLYEQARSANVERRDQTPLDDAVRWNELLTKAVYPHQRALANALNLQEDVISRTRSIASLGQSLFRTLADYPSLLNLKMLYQIKLFNDEKGPDETKELIYKIDKNGLSSKDVEHIRKSFASEPIKRTRSLKEAISYQGGKGEIRSFEDEGRVELSLKGLTPEQTKQVSAALKAFVSA